MASRPSGTVRRSPWRSRSKKREKGMRVQYSLSLSIEQGVASSLRRRGEREEEGGRCVQVLPPVWRSIAYEAAPPSARRPPKSDTHSSIGVSSRHAPRVCPHRTFHR